MTESLRDEISKIEKLLKEQEREEARLKLQLMREKMNRKPRMISEMSGVPAGSGHSRKCSASEEKSKKPKGGSKRWKRRKRVAMKKSKR